MSLIPTKQPWKVTMPDGKEPKRPGRNSIDFWLVFFVVISFEIAVGPAIGLFLGSIWHWPF